MKRANGHIIVEATRREVQLAGAQVDQLDSASYSTGEWPELDLFEPEGGKLTHGNLSEREALQI